MSDEKLRRSRLIASLLGPMIVAVTVSEALNLGIWETSVPQIVYLNGMILFAAGLAVVRFHNVWRRAWVVTITLAGWALLLAGLFRLFFPYAPQAEVSPVTYAFVAGLCMVGLFLTVKGYR